jgi:hypothetical protein
MGIWCWVRAYPAALEIIKKLKQMGIL